MVKSLPHIDQGSGYVQVSRLPFNQALQLRAWLPQTSFIKVRTIDELLEDCIQYSEYEYWFDFQFQGHDKEFDFEI